MTSRSTSLLAVAMVVLWSSGFVGAQLGTAYAPPHSLLQWRYVVAVAILVPVVAWKQMRTTRRGVLRQVGMGVAMQCVYLGCVFTAISAGVSAGVSALIAALQPLVVAVIASPLLGETTGVRQRIGLGIGIVGVAVVVVGDIGAGAAPWWSYLLTVAGMLSLSTGTVAERRRGQSEPLPLALLIQCATGAVVFSLWSIGDGGFAPPAVGGFWTAVLWTVFLSTFGGVGLYLAMVRRVGATKTSALLYLTPPTTLLWTWLMFDEPVTTGAAIGLAVCAVGVALVLARGKVRDGADRSVEVLERDEVVR